MQPYKNMNRYILSIIIVLAFSANLCAQSYTQDNRYQDRRTYREVPQRGFRETNQRNYRETQQRDNRDAERQDPNSYRRSSTRTTVGRDMPTRDGTVGRHMPTRDRTVGRDVPTRDRTVRERPDRDRTSREASPSRGITRGTTWRR